MDRLHSQTNKPKKEEKKSVTNDRTRERGRETSKNNLINNIPFSSILSNHIISGSVHCQAGSHHINGKRYNEPKIKNKIKTTHECRARVSATSLFGDAWSIFSTVVIAASDFSREIIR